MKDFLGNDLGDTFTVDGITLTADQVKSLKSHDTELFLIFKYGSLQGALDKINEIDASEGATIEHNQDYFFNMMDTVINHFSSYDPETVRKIMGPK